MFNDLLFLLLRASLTASLSDREAFIDKLTEVIEAKINKDPEEARRLSEGIAGTMEGLNGTLMIQQLFHSSQDKKLNRRLDNLTQAVNKLNDILEETLPNLSAKNSKKQ